MDVQLLRGWFEDRREAMVETLRLLVEHESPSRDKPALDALARVLAGRLEAIGGEVESVPNDHGGEHVIARFAGRGGPGLAPSVLLGHYDTVWPRGTLSRIPFRVEDGRASGPGTLDMKASLVMAEFALAALREFGGGAEHPVVLLLTSDEEIGSPHSRLLIEAEARSSRFVLVLEPPLPGGELKTARKGVGRYDVEIRGRAAHAGVEPEKGVSAIEELAHLILTLHQLTDLERGTTVNVGVVEGGTQANVVAAEARARVDLRVTTPEEEQRVEEAIRSLRPRHPEARITIAGGMNRPPMVRSPDVVRLFERARSIGRTMALDLGEGSTGGGSDGNFTAALGIPTLDGLGARGAGAHADHEHIWIDSMVERAALLAAMIASN